MRWMPGSSEGLTSCMVCTGRAYGYLGLRLFALALRVLPSKELQLLLKAAQLRAEPLNHENSESLRSRRWLPKGLKRAAALAAAAARAKGEPWPRCLKARKSCSSRGLAESGSQRPATSKAEVSGGWINPATSQCSMRMRRTSNTPFTGLAAAEAAVAAVIVAGAGAGAQPFPTASGGKSFTKAS